MFFLLLALISPPRLYDLVPQKILQPQGVEQERVAISFAPVASILQLKRGDVIELPTSEGYEEYRIVRVASFVPGTVSVTALALDGSGDHLALTFDGDIVTGIAQSIRDNRYDVFGSGYRAKVNPAELDHISCGADELHDPSDHLPDAMKMNPIERVPESMHKMLNEAQSTGLDSVTIDLLMVYTPKAEIWANTSPESPGSFEIAVAQAMNLSQQAVDISNLAIKLRMVHLHKTNYDEASGENSNVHLRRITARPGDTGWPDGTLGFMDEVHDLRDEYGADLVALLVDVDDTGGLAWRLGSYGGRPTNGFSLNRIKQTHFTYTLVHEIGHNMGNSHGRAPTQTSSPANRFGGLHSYSTGYRWTANNGDGFVTVMHYTSTGFTGTPYFSSTTDMVNGVAIGSTSADSTGADNARSMREIRRVIANYRQTTQTTSDLALPPVLVVNVVRGGTKEVDFSLSNSGSGDAMWEISRMYKPTALAKGIGTQSHDSKVLFETGFEAAQGFPTGSHTIINDWRTFGTNTTVQISNASPSSGSQHLRWSQSAGLNAGSAAFIDSPQFADSRAGHHTLSFDFRQSNPGSRFDVYVYDTFTNTMALGWIVDSDGNVFIRPGPSTGNFSFLGAATLGQYHTVTGELDPADGKIRYRLNGGSASESDLSGKTRLNVMSFVPQNPASASITVDLDNIRAELISENLPGFVFAQIEGTVRPGESKSIPLTIDSQDLAIGSYVGLVDIRTNNGTRTSRIEVNVLDPLSTDDDPEAPRGIELAQNFPNPFNPTTEIGYQISEIGRTRLSIYDLLGREVAVLVDGVQTAGSHSVTFDASRLASGMYLYKLEAGGHVITKKLMLLK